MPVLTDVLSAQIKRKARTLFGRTLTRPALLVSDGVELTYAVDVEINERDVTGVIEQWKDFLKGLPGSEGWKLEDTLTTNATLHNVPIARNNADLIYADVGSPVILTRSASGNFEVTGFAFEMPGTYTLVPVNMGDMTLGEVIDLSTSSRLLTLGEIGTLRPFGSIPFGASAIFIGGVLARIV